MSLAVTEKSITEHFIHTRQNFENLVSGLETEDFVVQPVVDVSPPKWHLAHTTWFFETFFLKAFHPRYREFHKDYSYFFNSYYNEAGDRVIRPQRGFMTRPTVDDIMAYRKYVDEQMENFLNQAGELAPDQKYVLEVGINHEQQHQELFLYDIKYILGNNPMLPALRDVNITPSVAKQKSWLSLEEGIYEVGHSGDGFAYDNEGSRHKVYLYETKIADGLVTNGEFLEFMQDGGYHDFRHWLSDGWDWVNENKISAPLHWHYIQDEWHEYTLHGLRKIDPNAPVTHISYYEADAFASWKSCRLPTEFEWEVAADKFSEPVTGCADSGIFHPVQHDALQWHGAVWQWTSSAYSPYPGFHKPDGALGEYNGKFMVNQMVLRGSSCGTWASHIRNTYRNFFHPHLKWMFSGIRLAK